MVCGQWYCRQSSQWCTLGFRFFQEVLGASVARRESSNIDITDTQHLFSGILLLYYVVHCLLRLVEGPWDG